MGVSTDAILFYGFVWTDEKSLWDEEPTDWEERFTKLRGIADIPDEYPADGDKSPDAEALRKRFSDKWTQQREVLKTSPCLVDSHCHSDCRMPYVAIQAAHKKVHRGYTYEVTSIAVDPEWDKQLVTFCREMGIDVSEAQGPGWFLVSDSDF